MEKYWLKKEGRKNLLIYILGWACTPDAVSHISVPAHDVLCIYDFRKIEPLVPAEFCEYKKITLVAWSFGVWVAERIAGTLPLARAIAFNGTPFPVNARFGMHPRIVNLTIRELARAGIEEFVVKTYGDLKLVPAQHFPDPPIEEKVDELRILSERSIAETNETIRWHKAFISTRDQIFPQKAMETYWRSRGLGTPLDSPHYPFFNPAVVTDELAE